MEGRVARKYLICLLLSSAAPVAARAQDGVETSSEAGAEDSAESHLEQGLFDPAETVQESAITVTATGIRTHLGRSTYPITVLTEPAIRNVQGPDLTRVLARLPGVTMSRNGGVGSFTGVRVRGAGAEQLLVLIDGVPVNDASAPGGGFDFGNLPAGAIEKVELLRGAHSVVWGADALAGVMNLTTRAADGIEASAEWGGEGQLAADLALGGRTGNLEASLAAGLLDARGASAAAAGTEPDGVRQYHLGGRAELWLGSGWYALANGRLADAALDIDGLTGPTFALGDTAERQDTRETSGRIGVRKQGGALLLNAGLSRSRIERDLVDEAAGPAPYFTAVGRLTRAELFGRYAFDGPLQYAFAEFGADGEWSRFRSDDAFSSPEGRARTTSGHLRLGLDRGDLAFGAGLRRDEHSRFGGQWTFAADGAVNLADDWRLRASYGEGFKVPTLFQLLSDFGNPALGPERSRSWDLGLAYRPGGVIERAELSLFRRDSSDLIDFVSCFGVVTGICTGRPFGTYDNVGLARAEGGEAELDLRPADGLRIGALWSFVDTADRTPGSPRRGKRLARRPRHAATLSADWTVDPRLVFTTGVGADLRFVGASFDDAANTARLGPHVVLDLRVSRPVLVLDDRSQRTLDLYGRIENVWNETYQTAAGYATPGRGAYIGARAQW